MRKLLYAFVLCPLILAACAKSGSNSNSGSCVAVVDLDKVANQLGWIDAMSRNLQAADADLKNQVNGIVKKGVQDIEEAKKEVIKEAGLTEAQVKILNSARSAADLDALPLTKTQRDKLNETVAKANAALQNASQQYQQLMQSQRTKLIVQYRDIIRPVAQRVAEEKESVVLTTSDNILTYDPRQDDITDDVIMELRKTLPPPAAAPVAAPAAPPPAPATTNPAAK